MHVHIYSHMDVVQKLMSGLLQCFHAISCHHTRRGGPSSIRGAVQELQFCLGHPLSSGTLSHDVYNCHQFSINSIWCSTMFIIFHHVCAWSIFTLNWKKSPASGVVGCHLGPRVLSRSRFLSTQRFQNSGVLTRSCSWIEAAKRRATTAKGCGEKCVIPNTSQYNSSIAIFMGNIYSNYHLASNLGIPTMFRQKPCRKTTGMWSFSSISGKSSEKTITPSLSWQAGQLGPESWLRPLCPDHLKTANR